VPAEDQRSRSLEEAEIRKLDAETTEIRVRTALRAVAVVVGGVALLFGSHLTGWPGAL
jgi:hypothetical protein